MLENRASEVILQKPLELKIGNNVYKVAKPTLATLIEVSKYVSMLPKSEITDKENIVPYILSNASKYGRILAKIASILIVGINKNVKTPESENKSFLSRIFRKKKKDKIEIMTDEIMNSASCEEISQIISGALSHQRIGFFLSTIISLNGANVSGKTKSETEATAPGE